MKHAARRSLHFMPGNTLKLLFSESRGKYKKKSDSVFDTVFINPGVISTTPSGQPCWQHGNRRCDLRGKERGIQGNFSFSVVDITPD